MIGRLKMWALQLVGQGGGSEVKGSPKTSMAITPLIVLSVMIIGYGFLIGGMLKEGSYIWVAIITGAGVLGGGILLVTSREPGVYHIKSNVTNAAPIIVRDYRLIYASSRGKVGAKSVKAASKVSGVIVKVTNHDAYRHRVAVDIDINDKPTHRAIRKVTIKPGVITYVAVPLSRKMSLEDIEVLSIRLRKTS